jgi:uncharacterized membrane protein YedE/YeeE
MRAGAGALLRYFVLGVCFGITLTKAEVVSWFRIQEMFRFQAFHMYGTIGSALGVAAGAIALIKRFGIKTLDGDPVEIAPRQMGRGYRYWIGGTLFGLGWALTGACPGPLFALVGSGVTVLSVAVVSALVGTWAYGLLRPRLPH